jgi:hypothetical protein
VTNRAVAVVLHLVVLVLVLLLVRSLLALQPLAFAEVVDEPPLLVFVPPQIQVLVVDHLLLVLFVLHRVTEQRLPPFNSIELIIHHRVLFHRVHQLRDVPLDGGQRDPG